MSFTSFLTRLLLLVSLMAMTSLGGQTIVSVGQKVSLIGEAQNTASFEWFKNGNSIATGSTLTFNPFTAADAGSYQLITTNSVGSSHSGVLVLVVTPLFTIQPPNQTVNVGENATFAASANGATSYQWMRNGEIIPGATNFSYTLQGVKSTDNGASFVLKAFNLNQSVLSNPCILTVNGTLPTTPPVFVQQPSDQTVVEGGNATFTASVTGATSYQWTKNDSPILSATNSSLSLTNVSLLDNGSLYLLKASNSVGTTSSRSALLSVTQQPPPSLPVFTLQPVAQTVVAGSSVTFTSLATNTSYYQWFSNGRPLTGVQTGSNTTISSVSQADTGPVFVRATNTLGSTDSTTVSLTVTSPDVAPVFTVHPLSISVVIGNPAVFTTAVTGSPTPTLQWQKDGVNISGATSTTFTIPVTFSTSAAAYTVVAKNTAATVTSNPAYLTLLDPPSGFPPQITTQMADVIVSKKATITLRVTVTGTAPLKYQWKRGTANISGATSDSLTLVNITPSMAGTYTCIITNAYGSVSDNAVVTVR